MHLAHAMVISLLCLGFIFMLHYKNLSLDDIVEIVDGMEVVEIWRWVRGLNKRYSISSFGRIKSLGKGRSPKILRQNLNHKGYLLTFLYREDGSRWSGSVHRLVGLHFIKNPKRLPEVNHKKGIKTDNRAWELEWTTCQNNIQHAFDLGLKSNKAENNNSSYFNNKEVIEFRNRFSKGESISAISKSVNSRYDTMWKIVKGINYRSL